MASSFVRISGVVRFLPGLLLPALGVAVALLGALPPSADAATVARTLVDFDEAGYYTQSSLTLGADGSLYGTAAVSSGSIQGTVFKITTAGAYTTLARFDDNPLSTPGSGPFGGLTLGGDGNFYGTTSTGGVNHLGTVFKMSPAGRVTTLAEFSGNGATNKGSYVYAGLTDGHDGAFYGTTQAGGASDVGTVFKVTANGALTTLVEFTINGATNRGASPVGLTLGSDDLLYGVTTGGGAFGWGTVFKMTKAGVLTTLVDFDVFDPESKGFFPRSSLTEGPDGRLYGTTSGPVYGNVFAVTKGGVFTTILEFTGNGGPNLGALPYGNFIFDANGDMYGTTSQGGTTDGGTIFKVSAGVLTTLVDFTHGDRPVAGLTQGPDGNFYGATTGGSAGGQGAIFKMTGAGAITILFEPGKLPRSPYGGLLLGSDGYLYGTTRYGGASGWGTIYKLAKAGVVSEVLNFTGVGGAAPGALPFGPLRQDASGTLYGTTNGASSYINANVYQLTSGGAFSLLASVPTYPSLAGGVTLDNLGGVYGALFNGGANNNGLVFRTDASGVPVTVMEMGTDAGSLSGPPTEGPDHNFYGVTQRGGAYGGGIVYRMTPGGVRTTLFDFPAGTYSSVALTLAADGTFLGTTTGGGASHAGTIFRMTTAGTLTTLAEFNGTNGRYPLAQVVEGPDGSIYGTTSQGGPGRFGSVFQLTSAGVLTSLVDFTGNGAINKGSFPYASLALGPDGRWYGATGEGGSFGGGTIFRLEEDNTGGGTTSPVPTGGEFSWSAGTISSDPQTGVATLTVTRSATTGVATVSYRTVDGSARAGVDYTGMTGVLTFADGQASQTITVSLLGGAIARHTFTVVLSGPSANAALGQLQAAEVLITAPPPISTFQQYANYKYSLAGELFAAGDTSNAYLAYAYYFYFLYLDQAATNPASAQANLNQFYGNLAIVYFLNYQAAGDLPSAYAWYAYLKSFQR